MLAGADAEQKDFQSMLKTAREFLTKQNSF